MSSEIRTAWMLVGIALAILFAGVPGRWPLYAFVPWLLGALALAPRAWAERAGSALAEILRARAGRLSSFAWVALTLLACHLFTLQGGALVGAWLAFAWLLVAARGTPARAQALLVHGTVSTLSLVVACGIAELIVGSPPLAKRFGSPSELRAWDSRYEGSWKQNVFGFRSDYEDTRKAPGVRRVLALGDSFTWGDKIASVRDTWPAQLEQRLRALFPGERIEVVNAGQRGWTTYNQAEFLRRLGWQFDPDLVVIAAVGNDALPSGPNFQRVGSETRYLLPDLLRRGAIRESAFYSLLEGAYNGLLGIGSPLRYYPTLYTPDAEGWKQMREGLAEIGGAARARGTPVLCAIYPCLPKGEWTAESYPFRKIHAQIQGTAEAAGLDVLDLTPVFATEGGDWGRWWATAYDSHPGVAAHALAAEAIALRIQRSWAPAESD